MQSLCASGVEESRAVSAVEQAILSSTPPSPFSCEVSGLVYAAAWAHGYVLNNALMIRAFWPEGVRGVQITDAW